MMRLFTFSVLSVQLEKMELKTFFLQDPWRLKRDKLHKAPTEEVSNRVAIIVVVVVITTSWVF